MRLKVLTHFRDIGLLDEQLRWTSTTPVEAVFRKAGVSDNR
jgi:hypothetical protein